MQLFKMSIFFNLLFFLISSLFLNNCFADDIAQEQFVQTQGTIPIAPATLVASLPTPEEMQANSIWAEIRRSERLQSEYNRPEVLRWIQWLKQNPKVLNHVLMTSKPYIFYIYQQTQRYQMPGEFALLPMVESAYDPYAFSSTGAVGLWQMMPGTAVIYGLDIDWWYDGRRDLISSTDRALNFLVSLREDVGDWLLAAASYNAGEGRIQQSQKNTGIFHHGSNFWQVSLTLPQQTRDYVPKWLAISAIIANPERYGVTLPYIPNQQYFSMVNLDFQLDMEEISKLANVSIEEVKRLNPGMRRWATSPNQKYTLLLPFANVNVFQSNLDRVAGQNHVSWEYHEVHQGQTLTTIAHDYHTSLALLRQVNDLTTDDVTPNQSLLVPLYIHRKYEGMGGMAAEKLGNGNAIASASSEQVKSITTDDILAGRLQNLQAQPRGNDVGPLDPNQATSVASTQTPSNLANNNFSIGTIPSSVKTLPDGVGPAKPIQHDDNLHTILNKLYGKQESE